MSGQKIFLSRITGISSGGDWLPVCRWCRLRFHGLFVAMFYKWANPEIGFCPCTPWRRPTANGLWPSADVWFMINFSSPHKRTEWPIHWLTKSTRAHISDWWKHAHTRAHTYRKRVLFKQCKIIDNISAFSSSKHRLVPYNMLFTLHYINMAACVWWSQKHHQQLV